MTTSGRPLPVPTAVTIPYWEGCRCGELRLQRCTACQAVQLPPQRHCRSCLGDALEWQLAAGTGRIVSWTVVRHPVSAAFAADVPYVVAIVALDEGPTMMAGIRGCSFDSLRVGLRVQVLFESRSDTIALPYFRPARQP